MAKSTRSNRIKRNRANLRSKVFAPESDARTERLAAKLQEIASRPKQEEHKESDMDIGVSGTDGQNGNADGAAHAGEDMDIDSKSSKAKSNARRSGRIQKRRRRNRHPVVFRSTSSLPNLAKRK